MNKVTRADVDVQPYAFTTKALFVGHMDHRYLRWQVVDTPGILDRPLEERNTIEMQAITALAHLRCCILYFLDISEQCGYTLDQQLRLFESIKPLFSNKQVIMVANKTDVCRFESLPSHMRQRIEATAAAAGAELMPMSNVSDENVSRLKVLACDKLLEARVDEKLSSGKLKGDVMSRITVVTPKPRDDIVREAYVPENVSTDNSDRVTEKTLMWQNGGPGVYACDYRKYYQLEEDEWRFDTVPEIMDGKNVVDFFDPDIEARLQALEEEEARLEATGAYEEEFDEEELTEEDMLLYQTIKDKQNVSRLMSRASTDTQKSLKLRGRSAEDIREQLESVGLPSDKVLEHVAPRGRKRERSADANNMDVDEEEGANKVAKRSASASRHRSHSATRGPRSTSVAPHQENQVKKEQRTMDRHIFHYAKGGEADRRHYPKLVKHLNSGKRSLGTSTIGR